MPEEHILVDSFKRTSASASSTDFTINLDHSFDHVTEVQLGFAELPDIIYNITSSNNIMHWTQNADPTKTCTLSAGLYSASALATEVQTKMNAAGSGEVYTVTYSTTTFKFTIAVNASTMILAMAQTAAPYRELGFNAANTSNSATLTSDNGVSLERPVALNISIKQFDGTLSLGIGTGGNNKTGVGSCFVVPLSLGSGAINIFKPYCGINKRKFSAAAPNFSSLDVRLTDMDGNTVNLNGLNWLMYLIVQEHYEEGCPCCSSGSCGNSSKKQKMSCH